METLTRQVQIREVKPEDLTAIHELENASFKDPFPAYFIDQLAKANPNTFLVAVEDGKILGYAAVDNWTDHQHLVSMAVLAKYRKRGIGQALLTEMMPRLRDGQLKLELRKSNKAALDLYLKNGFSQTGVTDSYYSDGEDAITMEKRIEKNAEILSIP